MNSLEELADKLGFLPSYLNCFGDEVTNSPEALETLINALGIDTSDASSVDSALNQLKADEWESVLPTTVVVDADSDTQDIIISYAGEFTELKWRVRCDDGSSLSGQQSATDLMPLEQCQLGDTLYQKYRLRLSQVPMGYQQLELTINRESYHGHLIVAPKRCYSPADAGVNRIWGVAAQLYSLSSETSWGIGDFSCLYDLIETAAEKKLGAIGLNPLHPLYPSNPAHRSPYSPTSRCFLNTIYIDVHKVPGIESASEISEWLKGEEFNKALDEVRASEFIDYQYAGYLKFKALRMIFDELKSDYTNIGHTLGDEFARFRAREGEDLELLAVYDALYAHFVKEGKYGWFSWPEEYHDPASDAVKQFTASHSDDVDFYAWLQWVADVQLLKVSDYAKSNGMPIGLYLDLAVGCDGGGAEVWSNQSAFLAGAAVGAPPDALNVLGQDWGLTPINPKVLKDQKFKPLAKALRCSMKYAGALRIDHILGFMRQYWIAPGMKADEGIYIRFPMEEMFRIIALESHRNQCVVIGEDLGTVPKGFDKIMEESGLLSYKVLFFERWESGLYKRPDLYPEQSMATVSTHDLHTLDGWWSGNDLHWRETLNLYPNAEMAAQDQQDRPDDKSALYAALVDMGLVPEKEDITGQVMTRELSIAVQKFLAKTNSAIQLIPMEDALLLKEQVNIPGTIDEHPNWKRKLPVSVDEFWQQPEVRELVEAMSELRPLS